jgi:hypothetical protein
VALKPLDAEGCGRAEAPRIPECRSSLKEKCNHVNNHVLGPEDARYTHTACASYLLDFPLTSAILYLLAPPRPTHRTLPHLCNRRRTITLDQHGP